MDRDLYLRKVLSDHLLDRHTYRELSKRVAEHHLSEIHEYLLYLFENNSSTTQNSLSQQDIKYFSKALHESKYRTPTFYGLIKIHKDPWTIRPVVSCCGSLLARVSTWVDFHLQRLRHLIPSYIKDSEDLQHQLSLIHIPPNTRLFTCDAISMYTNIDIDHSITVIRDWFDTFQSELPPDFPTAFLIPAIAAIMKNNVFSFGDTYWLQTSGTAMGTPCACMLATLYFSYHERTKILPKYASHIIFYRRFIDDVICLWSPPAHSPSQSTTVFTQLKNDMNNFGKLKWTFEPLSNSTTFLDLHITLNSPNISFSTYQKPHNLYLYLPPHSAHPPGIIRSLIYGLLRKYWIQNSNASDFRKMTQLLFQRLVARGHSPHTLLPLFLTAASNIKQHSPSPSKHNSHTLTAQHPNEVFLKWKFHPLDISRRLIQNTYQQTCNLPSFSAPGGFRLLHTDHGTNMRIKKLTIAYTRDHNLRDLLIPSRLPNSSSPTVSSLLSQLRTTNTHLDTDTSGDENHQN